ncbi:hypothetical protein [Streptomyces sp. NPDC021622]|uniref:hypothetical protein n=1 Tax=Streptomyces sp. NPDC021622 TaxID=3155013 RepID=UPI0033FA236C
MIKNFAVGFAGMLQAFLPASAGVTGGLVTMSAAFADWGTSFDDSEGFAAFLDLAEQGGTTLASLGDAAIEVLVALSPLLGVSAQLTLYLAQMISAVPTPVLTALAVVIGSVTVATKAWALAQAVVAARNAIWTSSQWALNASMFASPVFWIIAAIVALVAIVVLIATKTTWFQTAWSAAWGFIKSTTDTAVSGIGTALNWFGSLPGKPGGWFGGAKDAAVGKTTELTSWLGGLPGRTAYALSGLPGSLRASASRGFQALRTAAGQKASDFIAWVRGMSRTHLERHRLSRLPAHRQGPRRRARSGRRNRSVDSRRCRRRHRGGTERAVDRSMRNLVSTPTPGQATAAAWSAHTASPAGGPGEGRIVLDITGADGEFKRLIRRMVHVDGRGSVRTAFGA